jgi:hypothetical protein
LIFHVTSHVASSEVFLFDPPAERGRHNPVARCSTHRREMDDLDASLCALPVELKALIISHIEHVETGQILAISSTFQQAFFLLKALLQTFDLEGGLTDDLADHLVRLLDNDLVRSLEKERALELIGVHQNRLCEYACGRNFGVLKWARNELDLPWAPWDWYQPGHVSDDVLALRVLRAMWPELQDTEDCKGWWPEDEQPEEWEGVTMEDGRVVELSLPCMRLGGAVPAVIGQLTSLKSLHLSENDLSSLPAEIWQLSSLEVLYLERNDLTSLPAEIGQLSSLEVLYLSCNDLTSLPAEVGQLTSLEVLDLSTNQLTSMPAEIGQLTSLKWLDLGWNRLTSVPAAIRELRAAGCVVNMDEGMTFDE